MTRIRVLRALSLSLGFVSLVLLFTYVVFSLGDEVTQRLTDPYAPGDEPLPEFGQYVPLATLSAEQLSLNDPDRRAIIVGDIHGMNDAFHALLHKLSYDPTHDTLLHLGDVTAKGPLSGSLSVLSYMAAHNISGVRGKHDQRVLDWRIWIEWVEPLANGAGALWLNEVERAWAEAQTDEESWVAEQRRVDDWQTPWWERVPEGWQMLSDHYRIARSLTQAQFEYLRALPLVLHLPAQHSFLVHAGLLPYDPTHSRASEEQPLAHQPVSYGSSPAHAGNLRPRTAVTQRTAQELSILSDVPQNTDPWTVLNMRNVLRSQRITPKTHWGTAWAELWNSMMSECRGLDYVGDDGFPCEPTTIVFGHAAARGLDVKRWTVGLDSGCAYGRRLSALVLGGEGAGAGRTIPFGDRGRARIVDVKCHERLMLQQDGASDDFFVLN